MKEVVITQEQSEGKDELWCEWFRCPACHVAMIFIRAKFCPECGAKLTWDTPLPKTPTQPPTQS